MLVVMQWLGVSVRRQLRNFTGAPAEALTLTRPVRDQASAVNAGWNCAARARRPLRSNLSLNLM